MTNKRQPTTAELRTLLFDAVRAYMSENPRIGGKYAREWAVSTRVAIHLARTKAARDAEKYQKILVDAEYGQMGLNGKSKVLLVDQKKKGMKPDVIWHKRGAKTSKHNWLACEIKLHKPPGLPKIGSWDRQKLQALKRYLRYKVTIWISIPRTSVGEVAYYTEVRGDGSYDPVKPLD